MKMRFQITLITVLFSLSLSAQRFNGGILAGLNACQIDGDNLSGFYKSGLLLGAFVKTDFVEKWGGQLELKYSGKGSSTPYDSPVVGKIRLSYIDMPVLASYEAVKNLKIQAGLSFNYLFSAAYYDCDWFDFFDDDVELPPNRFETAITFGINYTFFKFADINARYSYSLMPIRSAYSTSSYGEGAWFNNVLSFALYFNIGNSNR
jgi:Outer membrane protein beta-barrel domain